MMMLLMMMYLLTVMGCWKEQQQLCLLVFFCCMDSCFVAFTYVTLSSYQHYLICFVGPIWWAGWTTTQNFYWWRFVSFAAYYPWGGTFGWCVPAWIPRVEWQCACVWIMVHPRSTRWRDNKGWAVGHPQQGRPYLILGCLFQMTVCRGPLVSESVAGGSWDPGSATRHCGWHLSTVHASLDYLDGSDRIFSLSS